MKHTLIALFVLATACTTNTPKRAPKETKTIVTYPLSINTNEFATGLAFKITVDSIMPDSTNPSRNIRKDFTFYRVAVNVNKTDSITGVMLKDSIGRQMIDVRWIDMAEKAIIFDYKKDWQTYLDAQKK